MGLSSIMTPRSKLVTTQGDASLASLRNVFNQSHFQHVPVVDSSDKVVGIVSVKDYFKEVSPLIDSASETTLGLFMRTRKVHQVMVSPVITVPLDTSIRVIATMLVEHNISCILVTDNQQHLLGLLSWKDIMKAALLAKPKS
ncbi:CBS domain-containing protein [Rheinheimera sp. UJ51]|uniref:CBS domain-containing protein n=1 Tax=unclassified Rheinheimera TaxID=115860 RepID=UPI001E38C789|nr:MULTISPECIES: CBS domain-containing protein [unclassified Rheinheimera]MCC5450991.1 CBS domain-containing protein [Rheinheimera sp. UJ51]MCF4007942.1 CBS domain-containing protein [Rheinheimera sp. UJ63]